MTSDAADNLDGALPDADGWTLLDVLGDDAAGKRFLVQCTDGSRLQLVEPPEEVQGALAFRERFKTKATRARDARHDCLVPTLGFAEDAGKLFLAEAHVDGVSLAELIRTQGSMPPDAVLEVGAALAHALRTLHQHGIVHGWVRPDAVVVTDDRALLRGGGLEHPQSESPDQPDFMSPEQLSENRSLRPESDFFSLGATLFAAIVGRPPFLGDSPDQVADATRSGRATFPRPDEPPLGENLELFFAKLLAPDPEQRPRSAAELLEDIEAVQNARPIERVTQQPPEPAAEEPAPTPAWRRTALIAAAALPLLVLAGVLLFRRGEDEAPPRKLVTPDTATTERDPATSPPASTSLPAGQEPAGEPPSREELAAEQYAQVLAFAKAHPRQLDEIARRFAKLAETFRDTRVFLTAQQKADEYARRNQAAHQSEFEDVRRRADQHVKQNEFGAAIAAYRRYQVVATQRPGGLDPKRREAIDGAIHLVDLRARQAFDQAHARAQKAVHAKRFDDAIEIYEAVIATYGIDEYVQRARRELGIVKPLLAARDKVIGERTEAELKKAYDEAAADVRTRVKAFDLEHAVTESEKLAATFKGSVLEPNARRHLGHLKLLLALKQRVIDKVNRATEKLKSERLGIHAPASVITAADAHGITLRSAAKTETRAWADLSDWEKYSIARNASNLESADDLTALGLLSLEQGNPRRARKDLERAARFGAKVDDLLARAQGTPAVKPPPQEDRPARMLVEARALVAEKQWLDALVLLIPLKEKHAAASYAIREKLDEIHALLAACDRGLARADLARDIAAGLETPLLKNGLNGWEKPGKAWAVHAGRVTCDNRADHDVTLLRPAPADPAYRLVARCRALAGKGLMLRVASDGDNQYDFWLEAADPKKCGLWYSRGGRTRQQSLGLIPVKPGEWLTVRAIVTGRYVRVECAGKSCSLPNRLAVGAETKRRYGFITRQESKAEFEDFRVRILREQ